MAGPFPKLYLSVEPEPYATAIHPGVCKLYLQNLNYFAKRKLPLSCGQPIAPNLSQKIKAVQWEDLDSDKFRGLLEAFAEESASPQPSNEVRAAIIQEQRDRIKQGKDVLRRARLKLKGYPNYRNEPGGSDVEAPFQIVQVGPNVTDAQSPESAWRCHLQRGRVMPHLDPHPRFFIVTADLSRVYGPLYDWFTDFGQNLWLIEGHPYAEMYFENGDVRLSELRTTAPIHLEPTCLYHFKGNSGTDK